MQDKQNKYDELLDKSIELSQHAKEMDNQGEPKKALGLLEEAEHLRRRTPVKESLPPLLIAKAGLLMKLGQPEEALDSLKEGEKISKELEDLKGMASILGFRIDILSALGRMDEAVIQIGRKLKAEMGEMPSDGGLPPDYWNEI
jgi:tetratricopeptide (TPR) repeat protein